MTNQIQDGQPSTVPIRMADGGMRRNTAESVNNTPLPLHGMSDNGRTVADTPVGQRPTEPRQVSDDVGHSRHVSDASVGQQQAFSEQDVGHDDDLPDRDVRHTLTTYEAAKMFEEADCRVAERTIIRWCNKNKRGQRRLDCAFEPNDRKYYISEASVKHVIREELDKGRQGVPVTPDVSDIGDEVSDLGVGQGKADVGHQGEGDRQRRTVVSDEAGHSEDASDSGVGRDGMSPTGDVGDPHRRYGDAPSPRTDGVLAEENTELKIKLAKLEEQAKTKDEMMTFLRKEIDRRGEQIVQDREMYEQSMGWFRGQIEAKDAVIERLNTEMRGLLEAPRDRGASQSGTQGAQYGGQERTL